MVLRRDFLQFVWFVRVAAVGIVYVLKDQMRFGNDPEPYRSFLLEYELKWNQFGHMLIIYFILSILNEHYTLYNILYA